MIQHMQISKSNKITQMGKNHMILSTDAEKASNKSQHAAIIKDLERSKVRCTPRARPSALGKVPVLSGQCSYRHILQGTEAPEAVGQQRNRPHVSHAVLMD